MTEPQTPPPPLFIVPGRRAVIRSAVTYDALMTHWFADLRAMRRQLVSWYEPLRDSSESGDFGRAIDDAISTVERQWIATQGRGPTGPIDASAGPGGNTGHLFVPRARLWKGPLRVLLEQKTYGVLGRTLRTGTGAVLDPVPGPTPRMMEGGGTTPVPTNGTVVVMINGSPHELRQTGSGEVTAITEFLPGDVVEFPIFRILAIVKVQGMSRAVFNPMGSPFLGDTVAIVPEGQMPESAVRPRVRIHDNLIAMRFQLLLGLTRGAFSSFRETFTEPAHAAPRITENPADATRLPTGLDAARLQAMHDEEIRSYRGERADTELAQPATAAATPTELTTQQQRSLARRLVTLQGIRDDLDTLARRTNQKLEAWQAAVRTGQHVARSRREYRTAYQSWYSKLTRYFSLLDSATDRRERRGHHRRDATIGSNYNDKANHHDFTAEFGEKVFAHGVLYGGSLTNTAPVAYGSPYRYFNNHWGSSGPGVPPRITISKKGYVSMAELRNADSDRLTLGWVCTPSTLATSYFMLHSLRMRGGGSVRSQFDTHCSIYCSVDANLRQIAGAASRSRFFTYWPAGNRSNTGGPLGLPFDEHALEEFVGDSQRAAFRFLDSRTPYFEGRRNADGTEVATPPRHPGRVAPRDVPQSAFNAWRNRAPAPVGFPVALEQLRKYFLVDKGSQFTVISLGGHEYMQVWFMPHALLKNEPVVTANGQGTWASLYASARPPLDQASIAADTEAAHETFYFGAPPPVDNDNVTTYEGVSSEVSAEAMRAPPADTSSTTPDTTTGTGTDAAATQVQHGTHAEMTTVGAVQAQNRRNARTLAQQGRALKNCPTIGVRVGMTEIESPCRSLS